MNGEIFFGHAWIRVEQLSMNINSTAENTAVPEKVLIRGLVIPSHWNGAGKVTGVSIKTFDEDSYGVSDRGAVKKLLKLICQEICIMGVIKFTQQKKMITLCEIVSHKHEQFFPPLQDEGFFTPEREAI
ncbi:MAG: hypothetical protein Q8P24_01005 [Desulfobacterales bacterium]|nr:hypothetical protein [Desulfobacterales bacterium]